MNEPIPVPSAQTAPQEVIYPESDGRPLGETGFHVAALLLLFLALRGYLAAIGRTASHVACDMFLYYEEGNPEARKDPDIMVIPGVDGHQRRTFKLWEENAVPAVVFEIVSVETWREDLVHKRKLYASLGVPEYFLFDPLGDCLIPRLQGFRLENGHYVCLSSDQDGALESTVLGLRLTPEGDMLRLINAQTGKRILTEDEKDEKLAEQQIKLKLEQQIAKQERQRTNSLAAEVARLQALLDEGRKREE